MSKKHIFIILGILVLLGVGVYFSLDIKADEETYVPSTNPSWTYYEKCLVEVKGEVMRPGIYVVDESYCINDCIILAGGVTKKGTLDNLKLASKVSDGLTIVVSTISENTTNNENKISINTATLEELTSIPGIGTVIANNIIIYRNVNGNFKTLEDLMNVQRVSENLFNKIKEYITL